MPNNNNNVRIILQDIMLNYAAGIDERNYEQYKNCFADNVEVIGFGSQVFNGREAWLEYVWSALGEYKSTQHLLSPMLATIDGDSAKTRSDVQAMHILNNENSEQFILWATYKTDFCNINDEWKIYRHKLEVRASRSSTL